MYRGQYISLEGDAPRGRGGGDQGALGMSTPDATRCTSDGTRDPPTHRLPHTNAYIFASKRRYELERTVILHPGEVGACFMPLMYNMNPDFRASQWLITFVKFLRFNQGDSL